MKNNTSLFTWLPMDHLPRVPEIFVNRAQHLARNVDLACHDDAIHNQMRNQTEYKTRTLHIKDRDMASRYQISLPMGLDWTTWVRKNLVAEMIETSARLSVGDSDVHGAHCDLGRKWKLYYLLDRGGDSAMTVFYQQQGYPIVREEISDNDIDLITCTQYDNLAVVDQARWPLHSWVLINTMVLHGVVDVTGPRLNLTVSVAPDLSKILCPKRPLMPREPARKGYSPPSS